MSSDQFRVAQSPSGGWYVIEHTTEGYDIPRGWTYNNAVQAIVALPYVKQGEYYPLTTAIHQKEKEFLIAYWIIISEQAKLSELLEQFDDIGRQIVALDCWDGYSGLWFDALQAGCSVYWRD